MADFDEDSSYLQPGFDPNTLTMPKLRNILFQHDIPYPSGAKKANLVEVFESHLRPKAKRILAQQARVKRTSMGIEDMSSQESVGQDEDEEEEPAAPTPARRSTRKPSATPSVTPSAVSARSRVSRRSTRTDDDEDAVSRSSRYSTATTPVPESASESGRSKSSRRKTRLSDFDTPAPAAVKEEPSEEGDGSSTPTGPSPFTMDNPFQSGSSPAEEPSTAKKTAAKKPAKRRPASSSSTAFIKTEEERIPVTKTRKSTTPRTSNGSARAPQVKTASLEPGEEFTREEQEELEEEEEAAGQQLMPARRQQTRSGARTGPLVILITVLAGVAGWWRQEKITAGYCGIGSSGQVVSLSNSDVQLPEFLSALQPQCEPCPQHAYCYADFEARCEPGFILQSHPLSFGGLVPLAPTCEPDSEKARKVKAVANRAIEELREQKAKYECGGTDEQGQTVTASGLSEETLKAKVSARRRRGMTETEFEDLWKGALGDVLEREEVVKESDGKRGRQSSNQDAHILSTTSVARLPLGCAIRRSARLALERNRITLALVILIASGLAYLRKRFLALRTDRARVPTLVAFALDRLATQAALAEQGRASEPYISMGGLRDDVLRDEFDARRRDKIWARVRAVVEMNANVRAGVREDRSGDISRVWEWIGPLPQPLESPEYSGGYESRRQSGRFSLGRDGSAAGGGGSGSRYDSSPSPALANIKSEDASALSRSTGAAGANANSKASAGADARKWDEGRAAY